VALQTTEASFGVKKGALLFKESFTLFTANLSFKQADPVIQECRGLKKNWIPGQARNDETAISL
jgi:hypothetical protein